MPYAPQSCLALALLLPVVGSASAGAGASAPPPADVDVGARTALEVAPMAVEVRGLRIAHPVFAIYALPGERVAIDAAPAPSRGPYTIAAAAGRIDARVPYVASRRDQGWTWTAPERSGLYPITVSRESDGQRIVLNAFVLVPRSEVRNERLLGYRIGTYPSRPLKGRAIYEPPQGFVRLRAADRDVRVSPHFTLAELASKQAGGYPKLLVLNERLLLALELVVSELRGAGIDATSLHVMSGFRTPYYNAAIGNVKYSLHQWGMAADVFVDENPRDGVMDDLDGDGQITRRDAQRLYDVIDDLHRKPQYAAFVGGTGLYGPAFPRRGPFVHVDVRGWRAAW